MLRCSRFDKEIWILIGHGAWVDIIFVGPKLFIATVDGGLDMWEVGCSVQRVFVSPIRRWISVELIPGV